MALARSSTEDTSVSALVEPCRMVTGGLGGQGIARTVHPCNHGSLASREQPPVPVKSLTLLTQELIGACLP